MELANNEDVDFDKLIRSYNIPPQPNLIAEIQAAGSDLDKIAELISKDVALSAGVLQIINSSFYGLANSISSIKQATVLLGYKHVSNIINSQLI